MLTKHISTRVSLMIIFAVLLFFVSVGVVEARVNNNDVVSAPSQLQDNIMARVATSSSITASILLVDLSDITNFKHFNSVGSIEVSQIRVSWTSDMVATTTLKFGVVASTTESGALTDVYWFDEVSFSTNLSTFNGRQQVVLDYSPSAMKLSITSGIPSGFFTGDKDMVSNQFATTTAITSPVGVSTAGSKPQAGDLVMRIYDQKGTATTSVSVIYRVK